jgi:hypothetical protein
MMTKFQAIRLMATGEKFNKSALALNMQIQHLVNISDYFILQIDRGVVVQLSFAVFFIRFHTGSKS